jgi:lipid-binding SYLF domain-containing protein
MASLRSILQALRSPTLMSLKGLQLRRQRLVGHVVNALMKLKPPGPTRAYAHRMKAIFRRTLLGGLTSLALAGCAWPGPAPYRTESMVGDARITLSHFNVSPALRSSLEGLPMASAIVILPHVVAASFVLGGADAQGILYVRDPATGRWRGPLFYEFVQGSVGFQAGASTAEVVMIVNSPGALRSLLKGHLRLGIDASVAVGKGGGANSAITADIDSYALSKGLMAGISLDGSGLRSLPRMNAVWYGKSVTVEDVLEGRVEARTGSALLEADLESMSR